MEYGVIYLRHISEEGYLSWIKYCHIYSSLPHPIQDSIKEIVTYINDKYKDDIIIPMGLNTQPGCITTTESVDTISNDIYKTYNKLIYSLNEFNIRLVYSIGEIRNINVKSIHQIDNDKVMVKVGRYLDSSDEIGIFKI